MPDRVKTIGIAGLGLIGTSIGLAIRHRRVADRVFAMDVDQAALNAAKARGAFDKGGTSYDALREADLVVVAVPPRAVPDAVVSAAQMLSPGAVLTDVASIKTEIVRAVEQRLPRLIRYVGGHPMAGSERQGAQAADPDLLAGRPFIVTPTAVSDAESVEIVSGFARGIGMRPVVLSAEDHDDLVAQVSHLSYLLAVAAVTAASDQALELQGPGFAGLARLAASPLELWTQICTANRDAIRRALAQLRRQLDLIEGALDREDALRKILEQAQRRTKGE
jgi:prephenate dehydrogenase